MSIDGDEKHSKAFFRTRKPVSAPSSAPLSWQGTNATGKKLRSPKGSHLGRRWRLDDRCVYDRTCRDADTATLKMVVDRIQHLAA